MLSTSSFRLFADQKTRSEFLFVQDKIIWWFDDDDDDDGQEGKMSI